jgi:hypothetical protein
LTGLLDRAHHAVHVLDENVRQHNPGERRALERLGAGDVDWAVAWYARNQRISVASTRDDVLNAIVNAWMTDSRSGLSSRSHRELTASVSVAIATWPLVGRHRLPTGRVHRGVRRPDRPARRDRDDVGQGDHPDLRVAPAAQQFPLRVEEVPAADRPGPQTDLHGAQRGRGVGAARRVRRRVGGPLPRHRDAVGERVGRVRPVPGVPRRDQNHPLQHPRDREPERPLPSLCEGERAFSPTSRLR